MTMAGAGFQSAYHAYQQDTVDVISNLDRSNASYCASVAALTMTNSTLSAGLSTTNAKLVTTLQEITKLTSSLSEIQRTSGSSTTCSNPSLHYCWTHRYRCSNCIRECPSPATSHQKSATNQNKKGGTTISFQSTLQTQVTTHYKTISLNSISSINYVVPTTLPACDTRSIVDSGCTSHFLGPKSPCNNKRCTNYVITVGLPNGA